VVQYETKRNSLDPILRNTHYVFINRYSFFLIMTRKVFVDENGYYRYVDTQRLVHRELAYRYLYNNKDYPLPFKKYFVHHKDSDKKNNNIDNLEIITKKKHSEIHNFDSHSDRAVSLNIARNGGHSFGDPVLVKNNVLVSNRFLFISVFLIGLFIFNLLDFNMLFDLLTGHIVTVNVPIGAGVTNSKDNICEEKIKYYLGSGVALVFENFMGNWNSPGMDPLNPPFFWIRNTLNYSIIVSAQGWTHSGDSRPFNETIALLPLEFKKVYITSGGGGSFDIDSFNSKILSPINLSIRREKVCE